jgi:hypothetical protein
MRNFCTRICPFQTLHIQLQDSEFIVLILWSDIQTVAQVNVASSLKA